MIYDHNHALVLNCSSLYFHCLKDCARLVSGDRLAENGKKSLSWEHLQIGQERKGEECAIISPGHGRATGKDAPTCEGGASSSGDAGRCTRTDRAAETLAEQLEYKGGKYGDMQLRSLGNSGFVVSGLVLMEVELAQPWEISRIYSAIPGSLLGC